MHNSIELAVEDKFVFFGIKEAKRMLRDPNVVANFLETFAHINIRKNYQVVIDISGLKNMYRDVEDWIVDTISNIPQENYVVLFDEETDRNLTRSGLKKYSDKIRCLHKSVPLINYIKLGTATD